jgi:tetratricopeptide (TPR) repeat protein
MAEISLRAYLDYIDDRLARDAYTEVVAQCRHILERYPKHIETYRVLARALAAQDDHLQDALDLFQRVLSADPNDFMAHLGMSDAYRESQSFDQAIWHLERAFEQVPNNPELQDEIRRLYQQSGKKAPRKIQLTSGALARMYAKGKLYDQAIAESERHRERPERLDLQVLLANALWDSHQEMEAGALRSDPEAAALQHRCQPHPGKAVAEVRQTGRGASVHRAGERA